MDINIARENLMERIQETRRDLSFLKNSRRDYKTYNFNKKKKGNEMVNIENRIDALIKLKTTILRNLEARYIELGGRL